MNLGDLNKVWEIKALKKPGQEEARRFLERIAKQVQPIMRRRKWTVKLLSEFCPSNLLGLNIGGGVEVKLRLRQYNRDWEFFSFEKVLDTMLHELCHNEIGPHNAQFYKLWDELRQECTELMAKGISGTGQGFDCPGRRLGGFSHQPPLSALRQSAGAAAEKRARTGALLPSGPKRLGGDGDIMSALSPIQAAAMAAERRMYDDVWCGSWSDQIISEMQSNDATHAYPTSSEIGGSSTSGETQQSKDFEYEKTGDSVRVRKRSSSSIETIDHISGRVAIAGDMSSLKQTNDGEAGAIWECSICTLLNQPLSLLCEACGVEKPISTGSKSKIWSCKFCTLENNAKIDKCSACGQWRHSYGPPVSTRGPYYGT